MSFREVPTLPSWPNQIFRRFQLPVQILKCTAKVIPLFGNQSGISKPINRSNKAAHHRCSTFDRAPESRLDGFAFSFEIAVIEAATEPLSSNISYGSRRTSNVNRRSTPFSKRCTSKCV
jgi:hypothetical protein